jgi:hypothetical protein
LDLQLLSQITMLQTVFKQNIITCFNFSSVSAGTLIIAIVLVFMAGQFKNWNASGGSFNFQCLWNTLHHFLFSFFPLYSADIHRVSEKILIWLLRGKALREGHYQKRGSTWLCLNQAPYFGNAICLEALPTTCKPLVANASLSKYIIIPVLKGRVKWRVTNVDDCGSTTKLLIKYY